VGRGYREKVNGVNESILGKKKDVKCGIMYGWQGIAVTRQIEG
jgi:hypothetical protein